MGYLYNSNDTMKILGHAYVPNDERKEKIDDVITAYINTKHLLAIGDIYSIAVDIFNLGVMYGKRDERIRRNNK